MKNKIIIYDDTCPLCKAYTNAFVKCGFIKENNRKDFSTIDQNLLALIDTSKCNNEIPVIDIQTKQVWYGVDALIEILHQKIPFIKIVGNISPIKWILHKLYKYISYNRRVIVAPKNKAGNFDCTPDFNIQYRLFFILTFFVFNTLMLFPIYNNILVNSAIAHTTITQLQLAHFMLIAINIIITIVLKKQSGIEYLGQASMLALITILLTIPLLLFNKYIYQLNSLSNTTYLILVTLFIIKEYLRRMSYAKIFENYEWVVYINVISVVTFLYYLII